MSYYEHETPTPPWPPGPETALLRSHLRPCLVVGPQARALDLGVGFINFIRAYKFKAFRVYIEFIGLGLAGLRVCSL